MDEKPLALSITDLALKDKNILGLPISTLAKKAGLRANDVYEKLLPALARYRPRHKSGVCTVTFWREENFAHCGRLMTSSCIVTS